MKKIVKDNKTLAYQVVYKRIKNTYFKIHQDHILVSTNRYTPIRVIETYLYQKFDVLHDKLDNLIHLQDDQHIALWGESYLLDCSQGAFSYHKDEQKIYVHSSQMDVDTIKKNIYEKEIKMMVKTLEDVVNERLHLDGVKPRLIKYKYLKSKFGSYHRKKDLITINIFLATQPKEMLLYVLLHEYAHVLEFNHSKHFYEVLTRWLPNHRTLQKRLKSIAIY